MIKPECLTCKYFNKDRDPMSLMGLCTIVLPPQIPVNETDRKVHMYYSCDLYRERP